jgi:hypothetical protein
MQAMSFSLRLAKPSSDRRPGVADDEPAEVSNLVAFSRGLLVGFMSAFVLFDFALMQGATTHATIRSLVHVFGSFIGR